ncbi:MAG: hypothetical protein E6H06_10600 [Bacteroidetes bacterium]|nr:MAG: hypothetical protein E6H06_10600 [Bacteroidota bacterium]
MGRLRSFEVVDAKRNGLLLIRLFDDEKHLNLQNPYTRWLRKEFFKKYGTSFAIVIEFYNVPGTRLLAELNDRLERDRLPNVSSEIKKQPGKLL